MSETPGSSVISARMDGTRLIAAPSADLARDAAPRFRTDLLKLVAQHNPECVTIDFKAVSFLGSAALGVLVEVMRQLGKTKKMDLVNVHQNIRTVLEITRLTTLFPIRAE